MSTYSLGETCSHIAALLFKVEACVRLGYTNLACTSRPCTWNQAFSKKVSTSFMHDCIMAPFSMGTAVHYVPCCPADWSIFTSQDLFALQFLWNPSISFDCCIISHIHAYRSNLPQLLQLNSSSPNILGLPLTTQLLMRRIQGSIRFHHLQQRN